MLLILFHLSVVCVNTYAVWYDQMYVDLPFPSKDIEEMPYKGRAIFLTFWCMALQTLYFAIALLNDIFGTNSPAPNKTPVIRQAKDILFSLAFPAAVMVFMVFWGIYAIHKDLIFPANLEKLVPKWLNHVMHTTIVPFILLELVICKRNYPTRKLGVFIVLSFNATYVAWLHSIYFKTGVWAYPFLDLLNWPIRCIFFVFTGVVGLSVYLLGEKLNNLMSPTSTQVYVNGNMKKR